MTVICFVGTSLVKQCDVGTTARLAYGTQGWFRWAQRLSGWRVEVPIYRYGGVMSGLQPRAIDGVDTFMWGFNAGISGQMASEILLRVPYICTLPADEYHVDAGTNDIGTLSANDIHNLRMEICRELANGTGAKVKLYTILARNLATWPDGSEQRNTYKEVNRLALTQAEFEIVNFNDGFIDESSSFDIPIAENTNDGTHISALGAYAMGRKMAARWLVEFPPLAPLFMTPEQNILPFGFLAGVGGTAGTGSSGTVVAGVEVQRSSGGTTMVCSVVSDSAIRGSVQRVVFTPSGAAESSRCYVRTDDSQTAHVSAGRYVVGIAKIKIDSNVFDGINFYLDDAGTDGFRVQDLYDSGDGFIDEATGWFEMRTPPLKLVGDSTQFTARLEFYVNGQAAGTGDVSIAEFAVVEVPNPEDRYISSSVLGREGSFYY